MIIADSPPVTPSNNLYNFSVSMIVPHRLASGIQRDQFFARTTLSGVSVVPQVSFSTLLLLSGCSCFPLGYALCPWCL